VGLISRILDWGDLRDNAQVQEFIRAHPFVAFCPAGVASPRAAKPFADTSMSRGKS
jgi:hypothetical protein